MDQHICQNIIFINKIYYPFKLNPNQKIILDRIFSIFFINLKI